jgi:2-dehydro-3-deoxygalactonokinase
MTGQPDASCDFLAADWGTSNLRAWRLKADGTVLGVRKFPWGVATLKPGEAAARLKDDVRPALGAEDLPAILCGMVGSAIGIAAAPYADCPAGGEELARNLLRVDDQTWIVPGLRCTRPDGYPDVIRGEETKVLGWLQQDPRRAQGDHVLCLPGTHGKWVLVRSGRIDHFMTCMTGELFALLSEHSVLKPGAPPSDEASFAEGLALGAADSPLASRLFTVRARMVGQGLAGGKAASYLSGLLIGDEVCHLPPLLGLSSGSTIGLMGEPALCALYGPALEARGLKVESADGEAAVIAGLSLLRRVGVEHDAGRSAR